MIALREYLDPQGSSPFADWFESLNAAAAAKVTTTLARIDQGNFSSVKGVGAGVYESRIDFGPGYRIYFGKDGETIVILLGGGTKKRRTGTYYPSKSIGRTTRCGKQRKHSHATDS
jgi:putative addiction module killer protein